MTRERQRQWAMTAGGVFAFAGAGLMVRGAWLAWPPAGWTFAGALLALPALFVAYDAYRSK